MKLRHKQKRQLIEVLIIVILFAAAIGVYLGIKFFLGTDLPLVVVASGSMRPTLEVGDIIIAKGIDASEIKEGDIVIFDLVEDNDTTRTVHRVVSISTLLNGTRLFTTKGDNNTTTDPTPIAPDQVYGQVIYRIPLLGYLALDPTIPFAIVIVVIITSLLWPEKRRKKRRVHHSIHGSTLGYLLTMNLFSHEVYAFRKF